jgi:SAM-dependent methyltransferase
MTNQFDMLAKMTEVTAKAPVRKHFEEYSFFRVAGDLRGVSVLDMACGTGLYCRRFKSRGAGRVVGVDNSEGLLEYARHLEEKDPMGIEYVLRDAADAKDIGTFDLVAATYLLHYAPSRAILADMCKSMRASVGPGGRLISICLNPSLNLTVPGYYEKYSFDIRSRGQEGDEMQCTVKLADAPISVTAYYWSRDTYNAVLTEAGFRDVVWHPPQVAPEGLAELGEAWWADYLRCPHAAIVTCET